MKVFLLSVLLCFVTASLFSQVVNIEKKRIADTKNGLQGNIDLSINITENTNSVFQGRNTVKLQYYKQKHLFLFLNDLNLSQVNGNKFLNDGFQHFRYNYKINTGRFCAEAFVQHQYNTIRKLERRLIGGLGPRFTIIEMDTFSLHVGPLTMFEHEELTDDSIIEKFRLSCYISLSYNLKKWFSLNNITYYQPNYEDFTDYRMASETNLLIKLTDRLALKSTFEISYDSQPPPGVKKILYNLTNGVSYFF